MKYLDLLVLLLVLGAIVCVLCLHWPQMSSQSWGARFRKIMDSAKDEVSYRLSAKLTSSRRALSGAHAVARHSKQPPSPALTGSIDQLIYVLLTSSEVQSIIVHTGYNKTKLEGRRKDPSEPCNNATTWSAKRTT